MGWWKTERGVGGDEWADRFSDFRDILQEIKHGEHEITLYDLADLVEFCSRGHLRVDLLFSQEDAAHTLVDGNRPLSQLHDEGVETYPNRGQIHCTECAVGKE